MPALKDYTREVLYSLLTIAIFALVPLVILHVPSPIPKRGLELLVCPDNKPSERRLDRDAHGAGPDPAFWRVPAAGPGSPP